MKKTLILFFITFTFLSCSKYEDGPGISFRSAEKRLSGKWRVSQILYDEKDITVAYYSNKYDLYPFNIFSDWSKSFFISITHPDGSIIAQSPLSLNKKKNVMTFGMQPETSYDKIAKDIFAIIPPLSAENNWNILRLKNDEFWIRTTFETNNFELHFNLLSDFNDY